MLSQRQRHQAEVGSIVDERVTSNLMLTQRGQVVVGTKQTCVNNYLDSCDYYDGLAHVCNYIFPLTKVSFQNKRHLALSKHSCTILSAAPWSIQRNDIRFGGTHSGIYFIYNIGLLKSPITLNFIRIICAMELAYLQYMFRKVDSDISTHQAQSKQRNSYIHSLDFKAPFRTMFQWIMAPWEQIARLCWRADVRRGRTVAGIRISAPCPSLGFPPINAIHSQARRTHC